MLLMRWAYSHRIIKVFHEFLHFECLLFSVAGVPVLLQTRALASVQDLKVQRPFSTTSSFCLEPGSFLFKPMASSVQYHCPCLSNSPAPPPPHLPSSSYSFHPLHALFFCEECDAVRCNRCVSVEVSTYYCPNCLFEVPSASVRAEKNRSVNRRVKTRVS